MSKRVAHLIVGLGLGGAETNLYQLLEHRTSTEIEYCVVSLGESHFYEEPIRRLGIQVTEVNLKRKPVSSLIQIMRQIKGASTLCCWMYHANFLGFFLGRLLGINRIIWCIRHSSIEAETNSKLTLRINRWCAKLSKRVTTVAYNGEKAREVHESIGYYKDNGIVLPNGCDCSVFCPEKNASEKLHDELGIPYNKKIVLSVTRNHPIKDIPTFVSAFSLLKVTHRGVVAVMCGNGVVKDEDLKRLCHKNDLIIDQDIFLLGQRTDVNYLMAGSNLFVLHSAGEAFPNVLIQAMACKCMCIATDVGDVKSVLNNNSLIVKPGNPTELANKMAEVLSIPDMQADRIQQQLRNRVLSNYSIEKVINEYERIFED